MNTKPRCKDVNWEELWDREESHGKDNADLRIYEKLFSIDDISKALQGSANHRCDIQRAFLILQKQSGL